MMRRYLLYFQLLRRAVNRTLLFRMFLSSTYSIFFRILLGGNKLAKLAGKINKRDVFVIASGPSINEYSDDEWRIIRSGFVISFNYAILSDVQPDIHIIERDRVEPWPIWKVLEDNKDKLKKSILIIKDLGLANFGQIVNVKRILKNSGLLRRTVILPDFEWPDRSWEDYVAGVDYSENMGFYTEGKIWRPVPKKIGTLSYILSLLLRFSPNRVVLCGVDLNNGGYFYSQDVGLSPGIVLDSSKVEDGSLVHATASKSGKGFGMIEIVAYLNKRFYKKRAIGLYVGKKSSALFPELEAFFN